MFDLGTQELIVIFIVAFLVFGPKRLPELGRTLGKGLRELKAAMRGVRETIEQSDLNISEDIEKAREGLKDIVDQAEKPLKEETEKTPEKEKTEEDPYTGGKSQGGDMTDSKKDG